MMDGELQNDTLRRFVTPNYYQALKRWKMGHSEWLELQREELVAATSSVMTNNIGFVEGLRRILHYANQMGVYDDPLFLGIRGVESETDGYPVGSVRTEWLLESLDRLERETNEYISKVREDCRKITTKYTTIEETT